MDESAVCAIAEVLAQLAGKAIMEGAKGGCRTTLVADAGRHGRVTGFAANDSIPQHTQQVQSNVSGSINVAYNVCVLTS